MTNTTHEAVPEPRLSAREKALIAVATIVRDAVEAEEVLKEVMLRATRAYAELRAGPRRSEEAPMRRIRRVQRAAGDGDSKPSE